MDSSWLPEQKYLFRPRKSWRDQCSWRRNKPVYFLYLWGPVSVVGIATGNGLDGPGIESPCGRNFLTRQDRPWAPPGLLYRGYQVPFARVYRQGLDIDHPPQSSSEVKERLGLYFSPSGPSWSVIEPHIPVTLYLVVGYFVLSSCLT